MTQLRWLRTKTLSGKRLIAGVVGLSLLFTSTALAQFVPPPQPSRPSAPGSTGTRYVPPSQPSRPSKPTGSSGTRGGCGSATGSNLTALAPISHNGQTVAAYPTFAWYLPDRDASPIEFTLYEIDAKGGYKRLYRTQLESTQARLRTLTLPTDVPGLSEGQTYLWQVALLCDLSNPSKDKLAQATIVRVAPPSSLKAALAQTTDRQKRADLYAQASFWYDALAEALAGSSSAKPIWLNLVADLSHLETPSPVVEAQKQGERLQTIVSVEQSGSGGISPPSSGAR